MPGLVERGSGRTGWRLSIDTGHTQPARRIAGAPPLDCVARDAWRGWRMSICRTWPVMPTAVGRPATARSYRARSSSRRPTFRARIWDWNCSIRPASRIDLQGFGHGDCLHDPDPPRRRRLESGARGPAPLRTKGRSGTCIRIILRVTRSAVRPTRRLSQGVCRRVRSRGPDRLARPPRAVRDRSDRRRRRVRR